MKINKEQLKALSQLPDATLWNTIRETAAKHGYNLPEKAPSGSDMEKIRSAMRVGEKINLSDAIKLMNSYKNK